MKKSFLLTLPLMTLVLSGAMNSRAESAIATLQAQYQAAGAKTFSTDAGKAAWTREVTGADGKGHSCSGCHGTDLSLTGKHVKTQRIIAPMAPSVNPQRLSNIKKVEKWLLRNCKGTWGRECTPQEKGDLLAYIGSL